jgi:hypothetical protein
MNKKGLTDVILVLVLSGIAVALIFIGIIYTYNSLACYVGVNLSQSKYMAGPSPGQFANAGIEIISNNTYFTNLTDCRNRCSSQSCNDECRTKYKIGVDYVFYTFNIKYLGTLDSRINIKGTEKQTNSNIEADIYDETTMSKLHTSGTHVFSRAFPISRSCESDFNVTFKVVDVLTGVLPTFWSNHTNFCIAPQAKDINVSVNSVSSNQTNVIANVSITGTDVAELCPQAIADIYVRRTGTSFDYSYLANQTDICSFVIDTNSTRVEKNNWLSDDRYDFRTKLTVINDLGITPASGELIEATVTFPAKTKMINCTDLVVTDSNGLDDLPRKIISETYSAGFCSSAKIWFSSGSSESWPKTFYVYSTNYSLNKGNDNINSYYPIISFTYFANTGFYAFQTVASGTNSPGNVVLGSYNTC